VVIVSNRGPVSFALEDGEVVERRGGGGLVAGLGSLGDGSGTAWIAAALSDGDRLVAAEGTRAAGGFDLTLLDVDPATYRLAYDVISNETLWFLHHGLFDPARTPVFDDAWRTAWDAYRTVNEHFAKAASEVAPRDAVVLVQDYHLSLVGRQLRDLRPDLRTVHFHHTPFCSSDEARVLPGDVRRELMDGLAGFDACGFHTAEWAERFRETAVESGLRVPNTFVAPLSVDADALVERASELDVASQAKRLNTLVGDRRFLVRVDRIELSKNLLRGFAAFDQLLVRRPALADDVVFGAFCYPSRQGVPEYTRYHEQVVTAVERLVARWGPVVIWEDDDDYPRSLAALRLADVVLVNPIRDGLNLVAKEATLVNDRWPSVVLSERAGVADELGSHCDLVNPFDVSATADAIEAGLGRSRSERERRGRARLAAARRRQPSQWLEEQLAAVS
jgi:trehalose 6-phosphate synthase